MKIKLLFAFSVLLIATGCAAPPSLTGTCDCHEDQFQVFLADLCKPVLFSFGSAVLNNDAQGVLERQTALLRNHPPVDLQVAGNADERGTETYNLALGQRRADTVRDQLIILGVSPERIEAVSYGKECPVALGHDEAAWQQNRNAITSVVGWNPQRCWVDLHGDLHAP